MFLHSCFFGYSDGNVVHFEDGYLVETVVEGNELGVVPYSIRVSQDGELFAVDAVNSNIVRITPPLSQCKLVLFIHSIIPLRLVCCEISSSTLWNWNWRKRTSSFVLTWIPFLFQSLGVPKHTVGVFE